MIVQIRMGTAIILLASYAMVMGQAVQLDIQPAPANGAVTNTTPVQTTVTVQPGATVPYEIGVLVTVDPTQPGIQGLGTFDINVLTDLGITQSPLTAFQSATVATFTAGISLGTTSGSDILGISGQQDVAGVTTSGVALGQRQVLGTGRLVAPSTVGTFEVSVTGSVQLLSNQLNPSVPQLVPASHITSIGFTIETSASASATPSTTATTQPAAVVPAQVALPNLCAPLSGSLGCCVAGLCILKFAQRRRS